MARSWKKTRGSTILVLRSLRPSREWDSERCVPSRGRGASRGFPARESHRAGIAEVHSSAGRARTRAGRGLQVTPPGSWDVGAGGKARGSSQRGAKQFSTPTLRPPISGSFKQWVRGSLGRLVGGSSERLLG